MTHLLDIGAHESTRNSREMGGGPWESVYPGFLCPSSAPLREIRASARCQPASISATGRSMNDPFRDISLLVILLFR